MTEYGYDKLGRLISTTAVRRFGAAVDLDPAATGIQAETTQTVFAVDSQIDFELLAVKDGTVTKDYAYDSQGRIESIQHFVDADGSHDYDTGEVLLSGFEYTYFNDGSRKSEQSTDQAGVTNKTWSYDGLNRLVKETFDGFDGGGNGLKYDDRFTHDFSSNRIAFSHDDQTAGGPGSAGADFVTTYAYDANDRLLTETKDVEGLNNTTDDRHTVYGYSPTDQTSKVVHQGQDDQGTVVETTSFTYDATGRMTGVSVTKDGVTTTVSYKYDSNGFRVERTLDDTVNQPQTTVYHVDPANPTAYAQAIEEGTDGDADGELDAAEVANAFTLGLAVLSQATATQVLRLLSDAHGSTRAVLDAAIGPVVAAVLQSFAYSAYGQDLGLVSPLTALRYGQQSIDPLTGLSFNRARWYDPSSGRFNRLDPFAGSLHDPLSLHRYLYGNANPINATDPSGQSPLLELLITALGGQSLEKLQSAYKAGKGTAEAAKLLVRLGLLQMELLSQRIPELDGKHIFVAGYYLYEWLGFEQRFKGIKALKLAPSIATLTSYVAALPGAAAKLKEAGFQPKPLQHDFLGVADKGKSFIVTFIPLTGSRSLDNVLALAISIGFRVASILADMSNGIDWITAARTAAESVIQTAKIAAKGGKIRDLTWHHNEILGVMELVLEDRNMGTPHTGGVKFWEIIHNERYK